MAVVGSAEVIVRAITTQVKRDIEKAFKDARQSVRAEGEAAGRDFGDGMLDGLHKANIGGSVGEIFNSPEMRDSASHAGNVAGGAFSGSFMGSIADVNLGDALGDVGREVSDSVEKAADEAGNAFESRMRSSGSRGGSGFVEGFLNSGFANEMVAASEKFTMLLVTGNALGPAIAGLVSSLSAAASGLFAMGAAASQAIGALAALPGMISIAAQAFGTLKLAFSGVGEAMKLGTKAMDAEKASSTGSAAASYAVADAQKAVASARRNAADAAADASTRVADAENSVRDAQEGVLIAQRALNDARNQAIESLQQLAFSAEDAALGEERAALRLQDAHAKMVLAQSLPPDNRARVEAELSYKEAELAYRQAKDRNSDLAKEQKKASKAGVKGSDEVVTARQRINDAQQKLADSEEGLAKARLQKQRQQRDSAIAIADAEERLRRAQESANGAMSAGATASAAYEAALKKLGKPAADFIRYLMSIKDETSKLKKAAGKELFPGLEAGLRPIIDNLFPRLEKQLTVTGGHLGDAAAGFGEIFTKGEKPLGRVSQMMKKNNEILAIFTERGKNGENSFSKLGRVLVRMLRAIQPVTETFAKWIKSLVDSAEAATDTKKEMNGLRQFFKKAGETAATLGDIFGNLWGIIRGLGKAATPAGDSLLKSFKKATGQLEKFIKTPEQQKVLRKFFKDASKNLRKIGDLIVVIGEEFLGLGDNKGIGKAADNLQPLIRHIGSIADKLTTAAPELSTFATSVADLIDNMTQSETVKTFLKVMTKIVDVINVLIGNKVVQGFLAFIAPFVAITRSISLATKVLGFFGKAILGGPIKMGKKLLGIKNFFKTWKTQGFKAAMQSIWKGSDKAKDALEKQMVTDKAKIKILKKLETQALHTGDALDKLKTSGAPAKEAAKDAVNAGNNAVDDVAAAATGDEPKHKAPKRSIKDKIKSRMGLKNEGGFVDLSGARKNLVDTDKATTKATGRMRGAFTKLGKPVSAVGKTVGKAGGAFKKMGGGLMALTGGPLGALMLAMPLIIKGFQMLYKNSPAFRAFIKTITEKLKELGDWFSKIFNEVILPALDKFFQWVNTWLPKVGKFFGDVFSAIGSFIRDDFMPVWNDTLLPALKSFLNDFVKPIMKAAKKLFEGLFKAIKFYIMNIFIPFWKKVFELIKGLWEVAKKIFGFVKDAWKKTVDAFKWAWQAILKPVIEGVKNAFGTIKDKISDVVQGAKSKWDWFVEKIAKIKDKIGEIVQGIKDFFGGIPEAIGSAFSGIGDAAKGGINSFIDLINDKLIAKINKIPGIDIPDIPGLSTGGRVSGSGGSTGDSELRRLSVGEYVIKTSSARRVGYELLEYLNKYGRLPMGQLVNSAAAAPKASRPQAAPAAAAGGDVWQIYPSPGMDETELAQKIYRQVRFNRRAGR